MREIKVGDEVVMIEYWPDSTGKLVPDQTTEDCRIYGFCVGIWNNGDILVSPEMDDKNSSLSFPISLPDDAKQGDEVAFHVEDAKELYPILGA